LHVAVCACRQLTKDTVTSAFLQAATYGWPDIVQLLVAKGGEVQHAEDAALRTACAYGHRDVVKVLLSSGEQRWSHTCSCLSSNAINPHCREGSWRSGIHPQPSVPAAVAALHLHVCS
jgi:ankyrin repeat protein